MKKLLFIIIVLQLYIISLLLDISLFGKSNIRTEMGYVTSTESTTTEIITNDGNIWIVDNFTCDSDAACEITFDTNGTENVEDDEIISITTYTEF